MIESPDAVLAFWFGPPGAPLVSRPEWFRKSEAFDASIRERFRETHAAAHAGRLSAWESTPRTLLALIVVLDQFPRNMYRGTAAAFASDGAALGAARRLVGLGWDAALHPFERQFAYLPFEHAESADAQAESLRLFGALEVLPETRGLLEWARKHARIIERFGRYPHRNAILGRASTPDELAFLREPDSSF